MRSVGPALFDGKDVASEEEKKQQDEVIGFAGLSSMVSDVDDTIASTPKHRATSVPRQSGMSGSRTSSSEVAQPWGSKLFLLFGDFAIFCYRAMRRMLVSAIIGVMVHGVIWLIIGVMVIGAIWLANQCDNSSWTQPQAPSRPVEDRPPIGRNIVLSTAQIRYCLAEKIRLEAAESVINKRVHSDVVSFNSYIEDYNSRCAEFRYREGTLESARRDIEPHRSELGNEGRSRFVR